MHLSDEELQDQLAKLQDRYAEEPTSVDLLIEMADVHEKLRDAEAAVDVLERALQYRKDSIDLRARVGTLKLKVLKKAVARADKAGDRAAADRLERELREFEVKEYRRGLELHPADAALRLQLGRALLRQELFDEAAAELQKAVHDPRLQADALFHLALCFQKKGFLDLARKEYLRALDGHQSVDERAREILYNLGAIAEAEGDTAEARSCYARVYAVDIGYRDVATKMEQLK